MDGLSGRRQVDGHHGLLLVKLELWVHLSDVDSLDDLLRVDLDGLGVSLLRLRLRLLSSYYCCFGLVWNLEWWHVLFLVVMVLLLHLFWWKWLSRKFNLHRRRPFAR